MVIKKFELSKEEQKILIETTSELYQVLCTIVKTHFKGSSGSKIQVITAELVIRAAKLLFQIHMVKSKRDFLEILKRDDGYGG